MIRRRARLILRWLKWYFVIPVAVLVGHVRRRHQVVSIWPNRMPDLSPRAVLFVHFDSGFRVRQQLLDYMAELKANGRGVVFVTNSGRLLPEAMAALREVCEAVIIRRNIGYDFGAWADAILTLGLPRLNTEELILANDSVFGPLLPLGDVLRRLDFSKAEVWGLTESWQTRYHLQSFFLAFSRQALNAPAFLGFWRGVRPVPSKSYIVKTYEIGVTQAMVKGGQRCQALWPYESLIKLVNREELERLLSQEETEIGKTDPVQQTRKLQVLRIRDAVARRVALNPTSDLWRQLLISGFPFIKRELLRDNPTKVEDVGDWVEMVREHLVTDPEPILVDLRTMLKDRAP